MSVIYVLLPLALLLGGVALLAFIRAVKSGQFDDLDTPPWRMLTDEEGGVSHAREAHEPLSQRSEPEAEAAPRSDRDLEL